MLMYPVSTLGIKAKNLKMCRSTLAMKEKSSNIILEDHKAIWLKLIAESITLDMKIMYIVAIPLETNCRNFD